MKASIFSSPEQRAVWARMVQAGEAGADTYGAKWWAFIKDRALAGAYGDNGMWGALAWAMSEAAGAPVPAYAEASWSALKKHCVDNASNRGNRNTHRENFWQWVAVGGALSSWLNATQRAELVAALNDVALKSTTNASLPSYYTVSAADSDLLAGVVFGLLAMKLTLEPAESAVIDDVMARVRVGGYHAEGPLFDAGGRPSCSTFRNAIRAYCYLGRSAVERPRGAEHIESGAYNLGTLKIMEGGAAAIRNGLGEDSFPELTALVPEILTTLVMRMTPGREALVKWGDEEHPQDHERLLHYYLETLMLFAGRCKGHPIAAEATYLVERLADETDARRGGDTDAPWPRAFLHYDPDGPQTPPAEIRTLECRGMGLVMRRYRDRLFVAHFPPSSEVESPGLKPGMIHHSPTYHGSLQVHDQGSWAPRHPHSYGGPSLDGRATNSALIAGLPMIPSWRFNEARGLVAVEDLDETTLYVLGVQGGQVQPKGAYQPPATYLHEDTRALLELSDLRLTVIVERVHAEDPTTLPNAHNYKKALAYMEESRRVQWTYHGFTEAEVLAAGPFVPSASWGDSLGRLVHLQVAEPQAAALDVVSETELLYHETENPLGWQGLKPVEARWHVKVTDSRPTEQDFTTHVAVIGRDFIVERFDGGILIGTATRTVAVVWNAAPSPRLTGAPYTPETSRAILTASLRRTGFRFNLPQPAEVYLLHLAPLPWHVDGASLEVGASGLARIQLAAGEHSVTPDGEVPKLPAAASELVATLRERPDMAIDIDLTWQDNSDNETAFDVELAIGEIDLQWAPIAELPAGTTSYTDPNVQEGTVRNYRIRSKNAAGLAEPSNVAEVMVVVLPKAATNLVASIRTRP